MKLEICRLNVWYDKKPILFDIESDIAANSITALIGPSGCGKTTLLRTLNRTAELTPGFKSNGKVFLQGQDVYSIEAERIRRRIGLVFQKPVALPFSVKENVLFAPRYYSSCAKQEMEGLAEKTLQEVGLWKEVCDALDKPASALSGGQLQRLSIARVLAMQPDVLLLDEPCSSLDPAATRQIEELLLELAPRLTILMVTHNLSQAKRIAARTIFMRAGQIVEEGETKSLFAAPQKEATREFFLSC